jgi:ABC-type antimicrobial peptide transport system permease subunit
MSKTQNGNLKRIFFLREFTELSGRGYLTIILLTSILTLTFLAIGVASSGIEKLKQKMSNPFTNWVNLPVSFSATSNALNVMEDFKKRSLLDSFLLDTIRPYRERYPLFISPVISNQFAHYKIRSISTEDRILTEAILDPKNVYFKNAELGSKNFDCGIILSKDFFNLSLKKLEEINKVGILQEDPDSRDTSIYYIDVLAVVKELPNNCVGVMSENLFRLMGPGGFQLGFVDMELIREVQILGDSLTEDGKRYFLQQRFGPNSEIKVIDLDAEPLVINGKRKELITLYFDQSLPYIQRKKLVAEIVLKTKGKYSYYDKYECYTSGGPYTIDYPQFLALNFNSSTKNIRKLKNYVLKKYNLELTMDQVEDKENFYLVSQITSVLGIMLALFGVLSIILFIYSLVKTHFDKIKPSLGTLYAFGIEVKKLKSIYRNIIIIFILIAIFFSFIFGSIISTIINKLKFSEITITLISKEVLITVLVVIFLVYYFSGYLINRILNKTPGDLIYNR